MAHLWTAEKQFWNDPKIVEYFSQKLPDPVVVQRLSRMPEPRTKVLLDLGCGTGRNAIAAMALGFMVHMCDPNPAMIKATIESVKSRFDGSTSYQRVIYGMMTALPYRSYLFDVVIACGVLHQADSLHQYNLVMSELSRVARQGCVVALNVFTNKVVDSRLVRVTDEPHSFITAEGLPMTLLPKQVFYEMIAEYGFQLEEEVCEEIKIENTGPRAILRANFVKIA